MQKAIRLVGLEVSDVDLSFDETSQVPSWRKLPIPTMLGLPLAMRQLEPHAPRSSRPSNESPGVYLVTDPQSGFAPPEILMGGLGPVILARTDGQDFTHSQWWKLHDYNCHLMDSFGDWLDAGAAGDQARRQALTPQAFQAYSDRRARGPNEGSQQ